MKYAVEPICEAQADYLSFASRKNRNALGAISYIYRNLLVGSAGKEANYNLIDLGKHAKPPSRWVQYQGKKSRLRCGYNVGTDGLPIHKTYSFKKKSVTYKDHVSPYIYHYFIGVSDKSLKSKKIYFERFSDCSKVLNLNLKSRFDELKHSKVFELVPLCSKYHYLIKSWLRANIVGFLQANDTIIST